MFDQVQGASEARTEPYKLYGEGGLELATKKLVKPEGLIWRRPQA